MLRHQNATIFLGIIVSLSLLYFIIRKSVKNSRMANDQKRRFIGNLRSFFIFIILSSVFTLWATELYQFIISIAALMAAFAIASKEFFLNFGGSFYRAFARPFSVGDRIEVDGIRGDVVDVGLMSTQLLEVGPKDYTQQFTGRTMTIPNAILLSTKIFNETDTATEEKDFVLHVFKVPIKNNFEWEKHKEVLLECAKDACLEYMEQASDFFKKFAQKKQVDSPTVEPRVNIKFDTANHLFLIVRICVPVKKRGSIEQEITNNYLRKTNLT